MVVVGVVHLIKSIPSSIRKNSMIASVRTTTTAVLLCTKAHQVSTTPRGAIIRCSFPKDMKTAVLVRLRLRLNLTTAAEGFVTNLLFDPPLVTYLP